MPSELTIDLEDRNSYEKLAELIVDIPSQSKQEELFSLNAEIRFGSVHIASEKISFDVVLRQAFLQLSLNDCQIVRGSRFADIEADKLKKAQVTATTKTEKRLAASATLSPEPSVSFEGGAGIQTETEKSTSRTLPSVQALAGTTWRITEHEGGAFLQGKYMGDENLCSIKYEKETFKIEAMLYCFPRDMKIENIVDNSKGVFVSKISVLRKKCLEIFVAKSIRKRDDEICISESHISGVVYEE